MSIVGQLPESKKDADEQFSADLAYLKMLGALFAALGVIGLCMWLTGYW